MPQVLLPSLVSGSFHAQRGFRKLAYPNRTGYETRGNCGSQSCKNSYFRGATRFDDEVRHGSNDTVLKGWCEGTDETVSSRYLWISQTLIH
jgi:hypothetical protein